MLDIFGGLRRLFRRRTVCIDNVVFRLHWMLTSSVLVAASLAVTSRQYLGDPIACIRSGDSPSSRIVDTYCWIHPTFTIPKAFRKKVGVEVPYPGIDNSVHTEHKYYAYYQWICFILFLQAIFFYLPFYLWSVWEGGLLRAVTMNMQFAVVSEEERRLKRKIISEFVLRNLGQHRAYAMKYIFCEVLALINILGQMSLMDALLDGEFWSYGPEVVKFLSMDQEERSDPMIRLFPRMTKCIFYTFGYSGSIQKHDILCLLPLNILNEKIYVFLWFWFMTLSMLTFLVLISRGAVILMPSVRPRMLHARCRLAFREHIAKVISQTDVGDWFFLYMLGKNLDSILFKEMMADLSRNFEKEEIMPRNIV
ncbi:innexin inx2-like [Stegodyphus dumicola]|uniref:innexin inx2-like n=1 Tax=Stegodyphus dumicola TaxID=202533 RepID=UPI0015B2F548|nr:innexin inx2-like [Stegodyphus dumicola]